MKQIAIVITLLSFAFFLAVGTVTAATTGINPNSNLLKPAAEGGILDTIYGLSNLQRVDDDSDQIWFPADGNATAQAKFAGFAGDFGYIPDTNGNGMFEEAVEPLFSLLKTNQILPSGPSASLTTGNVKFLWSLDPKGAPLWTSRPTPENSDGLDHMVTWLITGGAGNTAGNYVIAWEDLDGGGDRDFNDLVVEVTVAPVPIPSAILLLGSGLVAMVGIRRRFKS